MLQIFQVLENSDKTEGRGGLSTVAFFTEEDDAVRVAGDVKFCNFYGRPDGTVRTLKVYESFEEFASWKLNRDAEYQEYLRLKRLFS